MAGHDEFREANARGAAMRAGLPRAVAARYDRRLGRVFIALSTGIDVAFAPREAQGLERAKPADLSVIEISPSGFGLHFPKIGADLYLPPLLEGFLGSKRWIAARLGRQGGLARTDAKTRAARANGRLGGRPRKVKRASV
jgi:hypothetical protein